MKPVFPTSSSLSYAYDDKTIRDKIQVAFLSVPLRIINGGLIQFWKTITTFGSSRLSTENQPFAFEDPLAQEYRQFSLNCQHMITSIISVKEEDPAINITSGPHATALMVPHFPEVVMKLKLRKGSSPLVDTALDHGMTCLILLPVLYKLKFVGVVECCMKTISGTGLVFNTLKLALESVGLITYHAQQGLLPWKSMHSLSRDQDEIEEALRIVCALHQVTLAQVWINSDIVVSSSPSSLLMENKQSSTDVQIKQGMPVVKFCGFLPDNGYDDACYPDFKAYYDICDVLTLEPGEGFPGRTLQTHKPFFCKNVYYPRMSHNDGLLRAFRNKTLSSCFTICLRSSTHTIDYAFEFLWSCRRQNQPVLMECLLLTLKMCLPSFKFASGAQLGDEVSVLDVTDHQLDSTEIPSFKLFQGNRLSQTTLESKFTKKLQRPDHGKRKLHGLY